MSHSLTARAVVSAWSVMRVKCPPGTWVTVMSPENGSDTPSYAGFSASPDMNSVDRMIRVGTAVGCRPVQSSVK